MLIAGPCLLFIVSLSALSILQAKGQQKAPSIELRCEKLGILFNNLPKIF